MNTCRACYYYMALSPVIQMDTGEVVDSEGDCRRYAPKLMEIRCGDRAAPKSLWPSVYGLNFCGEFAAPIGVREPPYK